MYEFFYIKTKEICLYLYLSFMHNEYIFISYVSTGNNLCNKNLH